MNKFMLKAGIFALSVVSASVMAKVSPEEAQRLGADLTPIGAEKAASADGSIPAWDGGYSSSEGNAERPEDPFASDQIQLTITNANLSEHRDLLTPGQIALFEKYPEYEMNVYQTRRTAAYPQEIYELAKECRKYLSCSWW